MFELRFPLSLFCDRWKSFAVMKTAPVHVLSSENLPTRAMVAARLSAIARGKMSHRCDLNCSPFRARIRVAAGPRALARHRYHFGKGKGVPAIKKRELRFSPADFGAEPQRK